MGPLKAQALLALGNGNPVLVKHIMVACLKPFRIFNLSMCLKIKLHRLDNGKKDDHYQHYKLGRRTEAAPLPYKVQYQGKVNKKKCFF